MKTTEVIKRELINSIDKMREMSCDVRSMAFFLKDIEREFDELTQAYNTLKQSVEHHHKKEEILKMQNLIMKNEELESEISRREDWNRKIRKKYEKLEKRIKKCIKKHKNK